MRTSLLAASLLTLAATAAADQPAKGSQADAAREVLELHQFFEDWFNGSLPDTDLAFARFADVMPEAFEIIGPSGNHVHRPALVEQLRGGHGVHRDVAFSITVKNVQTRWLTEDLALVTYEEWQTRAQETKARRSSALLRRQAGTPNGLVWLHVHETWMNNTE